MTNTVISLKKSAIPSRQPTNLANGELAINFADGKLFYKNVTGHIISFTSGSNSFGTVNANGTLIVADTTGDILTLEAGNNIIITADAINDKITISSTGGGSAVSVTTSQLKDLTSENSVITSLGPIVGNVVDSSIAVAAFERANSANATAVGVGANNYANSIGIAGNTYTLVIATSGNAYALATATSIGNAGNNYTLSIGTAGNNYTLAICTAVGTAGNNYTNAVGTAGNNYTIAVGTAANNYMIGVQNDFNTAVGTGANAYALELATAGNNFTIALQNGSNTAVGTGANAYAASISNTIAILAFNQANAAFNQANAAFDQANTGGGGGGSLTTFTSNVGDGSANSFNVSHGLNSYWLLTSVREYSTGDIVYPDMRQTTANNLVISFVDNPTANQYALLVAKVA